MLSSVYNLWWRGNQSGTPFEMNTNPTPADHVVLDPDQPTCFLTWGGEGMYQLPVGGLIRRGDNIRFDWYEWDAGSMTPLSMVLQADGLYHWKGKPGPKLWAILTETKTHVVLTGNYQGRTQGIVIMVWPWKDVRVLPSVATAEFLSSQRPVWQPPRHPARGPLPDRPILGEAVKGEGFEMYHEAPTEPGYTHARPIKLNDLRFASPPPVPPVEDGNCSCGKPATTVVGVMTLAGNFVSTEPFCNDCFAARQTRNSG